jgi:ankyrin repeat protein
MEINPLTRSIYRGDLKGVETALGAGEDPNVEHNFKNALTLLCTLSQSNREFDAIFDLLIAGGANPLHKRLCDNLPMHWVAAECGNIRACERLYPFIPTDRRSEFTTKASGASSLYVAAQNGHADTVEFLLSQQDFDPNNKSVHGMTPLIAAVVDVKKHRNEECIVRIVQCLLRAGADPLPEFMGLNALESTKVEHNCVMAKLIKALIVQGRFEPHRYKREVIYLSARQRKKLSTFVKHLLQAERAVFAAFFNETCDEETSGQTEVFGPVAEELASMAVFTKAATRRGLRALEFFF